MVRRLMVLATLALVLGVAGCAYRAPVVPPVGGLFSNYDAPLTTEYDGQMVASKTGEASSSSVLGLFAFGDCSVQSAAKDGNLNSISYCDYSYFNVLGVFQTFTVKAHGE